MQPSSSTRATIISAANQSGATIVKATFFFCHYYIVWESNNAGGARWQSWHESLKSRWIPGGSCCHTNGTKRKHFAALFSPRPCWRWLQLQPSCGFPPSDSGAVVWPLLPDRHVSSMFWLRFSWWDGCIKIDHWPKRTSADTRLSKYIMEPVYISKPYFEYMVQC